MRRILIIFLIALLGLTGCDDTSQPDGRTTSENQNQTVTDNADPPLTPLDRELGLLIRRYQLSGDPVQDTPVPDIRSPKAQLGKKLFFSRTLSGELDVACASCHHPMLGGGDNLSLPIGVNSAEPHRLGPGRRHKGALAPDIARNAPTTFNVALWKRVLFHDGRIERLASGGITTPDVPYPTEDPLAGSDLVQAQARFPLTSDSEMRGKEFDKHGTTQSCRVKLAERLGGYGRHAGELDSAETDYWLNEFRIAFNAPDGLPNTLITEQNISALLSVYQRSQVFVNNPWSEYVQGERTAISEHAKQGGLLFYRQPSEGGYGCVNCHSGDFFTNEQFFHTLLPPVGPGKKGLDGILKANRDPGRSLVTKKAEDRFKFRTPSLLNVEVTGPWGHNGAYTTLANMVRHMINPFQMALNYDRYQLQQSRVQTQSLNEGIREMLLCDVAIPGKDYTDNEVQALVAFLLTLTDPCVKDRACMQPWLPDRTKDMDPMGLLLLGRDNQGKSL